MPDQLPLFTINQPAPTLFLDQYTALEDEIDRLKADMLLCVEQYRPALPMRAVLTALKVARARRKLTEHVKEPLPYAHQATLEDLVERHLDGREEEVARLTEEVGA